MSDLKDFCGWSFFVDTGGTFTDWQGNPVFTSGEGIGTNGLVAKEVLEITRQYSNKP